MRNLLKLNKDMPNTSDQYNAVIKMCRDLFEKKMSDYGAAWRILRLPSLTDQIFIKALYWSEVLAMSLFNLRKFRTNN